MEATSTQRPTTTSSKPQDPNAPLILQVDFTWRKFQCLISEKSDPENRPLYIGDSKAMKSALHFLKGPEREHFATSHIHPVSIDAECEIRGKPIKLKAMKRLKTQYAHFSYAVAGPGKEPVPVDWNSASSWKTWDFICSDSNGNPIAKYEAHIWNVSKIGFIEFTKPRSELSEELIEEMVVTGLTVSTTMMFRTANILNLFGAIFSTPGYKDKTFVAPKGVTAGNSGTGGYGSAEQVHAVEVDVTK